MLRPYKVSLALIAAIASVDVLVKAQNGNIENCPGYRASNVTSTGSTLTADLTLSGPACDAYGTDLTDLRLTVEYQTGRVKRTQSRIY
jgi:alpha-glucosidase